MAYLDSEAGYAREGVLALLADIPRGKNSQVYVVDPATGSDSNDGRSIRTALLTLPAAYAKTVDGQNDVVAYLAGASSLTLTAQLAWAKSYTHLVGLCAPVHAGQRARIFAGAANTASPMIDVTGSGCIFKNIYVFQGVADAAALLNVRVTGSRNYFENVHFAGGGHATQAIDGGASLNLTGSENRFKDCTIGLDTIAAATGMMALLFPTTGGGARNVFEDCLFTMHAGAAGAGFVELLGNFGIDRYQIFRRCGFVNLSATAMDSAFVIAAGFDSANKRFLLDNCWMIGAAKWEASDQNAVYGGMPDAAGTDSAGVMVTMQE